MIDSIKNVLSDKLPHDVLARLRDLSYNVSYPPSQFSPFAERLVLVLGCQRSGNTLTYLMLNAHSSIYGVDESDVGYSFPAPSTLRALEVDSDSLIALKFPTKTAKSKYVLKHLSRSKIVWPTRNPYAVVSSMLNWQEDGKEGNWMELYGANELWQHSFLFPEILGLETESLNDVALGAYLWKYKELTLQWLKENDLPVYDFQFETLLENPGQVMGEIVQFLGLEWDENVLSHEDASSPGRKYPGGTDSSKAIDTSRKSPDLALSSCDLEVVADICGEAIEARSYGVPG